MPTDDALRETIAESLASVRAGRVTNRDRLIAKFIIDALRAGGWLKEPGQVAIEQKNYDRFIKPYTTAEYGHSEDFDAAIAEAEG